MDSVTAALVIVGLLLLILWLLPAPAKSSSPPVLRFRRVWSRKPAPAPAEPPRSSWVDTQPLSERARRAQSAAAVEGVIDQTRLSDGAAYDPASADAHFADGQSADYDHTEQIRSETGAGQREAQNAWYSSIIPWAPKHNVYDTLESENYIHRQGIRAFYTQDVPRTRGASLQVADHVDGDDLARHRGARGMLI
jgi:hypothetical protein